MKRREFLKTTLAATGGLMAVHESRAAAQPKSDELRVALVGAGTQGKLILSAVAALQNVRLQAVCDIWEYAQNYAVRFSGLQGNRELADHVYTELDDLLQKESGLDAVLIATPDFVHAKQANAALEAGLHVYCEPMMARTIEEAQSMVATARKTDKLLQIGYQRRSNHRYQHVFEKLIVDANLIDRMTSIQTQWAEPEADLSGFPRKFPLADDLLQRYGYRSMTEFRNWLWFPRYSAGPFCSRVSHQLDVCHWYLESTPQSVQAMASNEFYADRPSADTVMATYQFLTADGPLLASCNMLLNTSGGGMRIYERFCGTSASLQVSENPYWIKICREANAEEWDKWIRRRYVTSPQKKSAADPDADTTDVQVSGEVEEYGLPVVMEKAGCQAHLENFFAAIRGDEDLNCPPEVAFRAHVVALKSLEAAQNREVISLVTDDFE
jgi:predicted dehydrogenase